MSKLCIFNKGLADLYLKTNEVGSFIKCDKCSLRGVCSEQLKNDTKIFIKEIESIKTK
jgi:hypothetical protein